MTHQLAFRAAQSHESAQGANLIMLTLREFGTHFFGFGSRPRAIRVLEQLFMQPGSRFSHQHVLFGVRENGQIAGLLMPFTRRSMRRTWLATALQLIRIYNPAEMLTFIQRLLQYRFEERISQDELYIAHLAVDPHHQRSGYGQQLLSHAAQLAQSQGLKKLSLLTEIENQPAINLYHKSGFIITETIPYPPDLHYLGSKASLRMVKNLIKE